MLCTLKCLPLIERNKIMEQYDIRFKLENFDFHSRTIIYNKEKNKVLLFKDEDRRSFYLLPGGKIQLGEDSLSTIKREVNEEIGYSLNYYFVVLIKTLLN